MRRQNWMSLALFALLLNSSLVHAANSITSMTPDRVQPGQVVTLHGQFSVAKFRSRQYRIVMSKQIAPRPQGAINGPVDSFRVTPTSIMVRIPRTWRGKPVSPGEYVIYIRDMVDNRFVRSGGVNTPRILVTSETRTSLGAAKKNIQGQIKRHQQQQLGGNIGRAANPNSSFGRGNLGAGIARARGAAQMKLTLRGLKVNNRDAIRNGVSIGDNVVAAFNIRNLGTAPGQVKVGYMSSGLINARPVFTTNGLVTVAPGQTVPMLLSVRINARNTDRNINRRAWNPIFRLLTTGNNTYRDPFMADNVIARNGIPLKAKEDLALVSIEGVKLAESWQGGGQWDKGTTHPVSLEFLVKVKNNGAQNSQPTRLSITVMGKRSAYAEALSDPRVERHSVGSCAHWPICTMNQDVSIPGIAGGQTGTFRVRFSNIPHQIVYSKRYGAKVAIGPYICSKNGWATPGRASIIAHLRQADVDEAPSFRANNYLILAGKFGRWGRGKTSCGMENKTRARRTGKPVHFF